MRPRYSVIIPARNGGDYLKECINTVIPQNYTDYELIISDDHSTDGSREYLAGYKNHLNLKIIEPPRSLSMTEHWEWALSHASGQWQIFVGQDDGLQPYFFHLADILTRKAETAGIRAIMSERAYYFWPGCSAVYGDISVSYRAVKKIKVHYSAAEGIKALLGIQNYFELPEMYTTSLFHSSLLDEVREKQGGRVFTCHPQDANLGVIAVSLEKKYLKSYIPLGWVGTSPKSAGMAISAQNIKTDKESSETLKNLNIEYTQKILKSPFKYNYLAGDFSFGDNPLYFWQAFLETTSLRPEWVNRIIISRTFRYIFFGALQGRMWIHRYPEKKKQQYREILKINKIGKYKLLGAAVAVSVPVFILSNLFLLDKGFRILLGLMMHKAVLLRHKRRSGTELSMTVASEIIMKKVTKII